MKKRDRLNVLTCPTHEAYESALAQTGHEFYAIRTAQAKDWNSVYRALPKNYHLLDSTKGERQISAELALDVVLAQTRFGQYQTLAPIASRLHLPLITVEHVQPPPQSKKAAYNELREMRGHANVFITDFSRKAWGFDEKDSLVIPHGIDEKIFFPLPDQPREAHLLSVVNDWINRTQPCGYHFWKEATDGLPVKVLGDTPSLSKPAKSLSELVEAYRQSQIFVNTSLVSPVPMSLLEAMACACCPISTATCAIPELIRHGENGLLASTPLEMRKLCMEMLSRPDECRRLGENARKTIQEKHSLLNFVNAWNEVFAKAMSIVPYRNGEFLCA